MIRPATPSDVPAISQLMAEAFWDDDAISDYFKGIAQIDLASERAERAAALAPIFARQLEVDYLPNGVVDVAAEGSQILGAALWSLPGASYTSFSDYVRMYGGHAYRMLLRDVQSGELHPEEPHWYLYTLTVSPAAQGKGIGSSLLAHGLQRADDSSRPVYLEATSVGSQRLYERKGFRLMREIPTSEDERPNEVGMVRPVP